MKFLRKRILHLSDIPGDIDSVISVDEKKEVDPQLVGMAQDDVDEIWHRIVKLYKTGGASRHLGQYQASGQSADVPRHRPRAGQWPGRRTG